MTDRERQEFRMEQESLQRIAERLDQAAAQLPSPPAGLAADALARARRERRKTGSADGRVRWPALGRPAYAGALLAAAFAVLLVTQASWPGRVRQPGGQPQQLARQVETPEAGEAAPESTGPQVMMLASEERRAPVFTGDAREAERVAGRLSEAGIGARRETVASGVEVTVAPSDLERARKLLDGEPAQTGVAETESTKEQ